MSITRAVGLATSLVNLSNLPILACMVIPRTITASDAKARLGQVLGSLVADGPVSITRNGRLVGVLAAPIASPAAPQQLRGAATHLDTLAALYSAGAISWRRIADETGAAFGELLLSLSRQGLALPEVTAPKRPAQAALWEAALRQAAGR